MSENKAGSSSLASNPAFANNPFVIGNRKHRMSTEERETEEEEKYIMATDEKHESNLAFYPDDSPTPESPTRSPTPVASSPARIEVQQEQLTWVDVAALVVILGPLRQYVKCSPLSVVRCTSDATGRWVEDFRILGSE